jgi:hypothetical protein
MAGFGSQKRGTGRAVKKFAIGGSSIYASAYLGKPGYTEAEIYINSLILLDKLN